MWFQWLGTNDTPEQLNTSNLHVAQKLTVQWFSFHQVRTRTEKGGCQILLWYRVHWDPFFLPALLPLLPPHSRASSSGQLLTETVTLPQCSARCNQQQDLRHHDLLLPCNLVWPLLFLKHYIKIIAERICPCKWLWHEQSYRDRMVDSRWSVVLRLGDFWGQ